MQSLKVPTKFRSALEEFGLLMQKSNKGKLYSRGMNKYLKYNFLVIVSNVDSKIRHTGTRLYQVRITQGIRKG